MGSTKPISNESGYTVSCEGSRTTGAMGRFGTHTTRLSAFTVPVVVRFVTVFRVIPRWPHILRKTSKVAIAVIALASGSLWGWDQWRSGRYVESTDDAYIKADTTNITSRVTAPVEAVLVKDNQRVHVGDLLVRLDDRNFHVGLAKAAAQSEANQAQIDTVHAKLRLQMPAIANARAELAATWVEAERARFDAERYAYLQRGHAAPAQRAEQANADRARADAQHSKAAGSLEAAEREMEVLTAQLHYAEAGLAEARAEEDAARLNVSYCEIRSPIDGEVGNRSARPGSYASAGAPLLSIVPEHGLWIEANFKENQIPDMRTGQRAALLIDALPDTILHGLVGGMAPATGAEFALLPPQNATGNFTKIVQRIPIRIDLDGDDAPGLGKIRPGLSVVVSVDTRDHSSDMRYAVAPSEILGSHGPAPEHTVSR